MESERLNEITSQIEQLKAYNKRIKGELIFLRVFVILVLLIQLYNLIAPLFD